MTDAPAAIPTTRLARLRARHGRSAALVSLGLLVALIVQNLYWQREIQRTAPAEQRIHRSTRDLPRLASKNVHPSIAGRLSVYYRLAEHIAGATLAIPAWMHDVTWMFERVARVEVVIAPDDPVVPLDREPALAEASLPPIDWFVKGRRGRHKFYKKMFFVFEPGAVDYVIARSDDGKRLFVMPRTRLAEAAP